MPGVASAQSLLEWSKFEKPVSFCAVSLAEELAVLVRDLGSAIDESWTQLTVDPLPVVHGDRTQLGRA